LIDEVSQRLVRCVCRIQQGIGGVLNASLAWLPDCEAMTAGEDTRLA
jgi:hypothetical protein